MVRSAGAAWGHEQRRYALESCGAGGGRGGREGWWGSKGGFRGRRSRWPRV